MDGVSLALAVKDIAQTIFALVKYFEDVSQASESARELLLELSTLTAVLGRLEQFLRSDAKHLRFKQTSVLVAATLACKNKVNELESALRAMSTHTKDHILSKGIRRLKWPFNEQEHRQALDDIRGYCQVFQFSLILDEWCVRST